MGEFRILRYVSMVAVLIVAGDSSNAQERNLAPLAAAVAERFGTTTTTIRLENMKTVYQRKDGARYFEKVSEEFDGKVEHKTANGESDRAYGPEDRKEDTKNSYSRITVSHFDGKIFLKSEIRYEMEGTKGADIFEKTSTYQMQIVEGTWEDYEQGASIKLAISSNDRERYAADLNEMVNQPKFLDRYGEQFRKGFEKNHLRKVEEKKKEGVDTPAFRLFVDSVDYMIEKAKVDVSAKAESSAPTFILEGDTLTELVDRAITELNSRFVVSSPAN